MSDEFSFSIRSFLPEDRVSVIRIWKEGRLSLKRKGINQWQKGDYPGENEFLEDLRQERGKVIVLDGCVVAAFAYTTEAEPSYSTLSGEWLNRDGGYLTIHRSAVAKRYRGMGIMGFILSSSLLLAGELGLKSVRIDTHEENKDMQRALEKAGFTRVGTLTLLDGSEKGDERLGFERLVSF